MSEPSTSYLVLPISLRPKSKLVRHLYLKPQSGQGNLPQGRAVFVAGLPAELHEGAILDLFTKFGEVEKAAVHGSRLSAVVLYTSKQGRDAALKAATKGKTIRLDISSLSNDNGSFQRDRKSVV